MSLREEEAVSSSPDTENAQSSIDEKQGEENPLPPTIPHGTHLDPPPDGGLIAWSVVLGAWCTSFCSFGWLNSVGIFQEYYQTELLNGYSSSTIAWIPSLQVFFMLASGPVVGHFFDRHGPRYIILIGTFMHVFGLMMASISKTYYQVLLSQGICSAIGASAIFQPALSSVGGWFDKNRGAAFGALSTGSSMGGVLFPIMVTHLIKEIGFGWAMRTVAFIIFFLLIIANLTIRCRVPPHPQKLSAQALHRPLHEPILILVIAGFALLTFGVFVPIDYIVLTAISNGMSTGLAQYLVSILNAASFFGRVGAGLFADKVGRFNVFIFVCGISGILILGLWIPGSSNVTSFLFAAFFGFFSGAYVSLSPALVAQISPPHEIGYRLGLLFFFAAVPGLVTNPIAGAILSHNHGSYTGMKVFAGIFCLAGSAVVAIARLLKTGFKPFAIF